jgi:hypothetical protein
MSQMSTWQYEQQLATPVGRLPIDFWTYMTREILYAAKMKTHFFAAFWSSVQHDNPTNSDFNESRYQFGGDRA